MLTTITNKLRALYLSWFSFLYHLRCYAQGVPVWYLDEEQGAYLLSLPMARPFDSQPTLSFERRAFCEISLVDPQQRSDQWDPSIGSYISTVPWHDSCGHCDPDA